MAGTQNGLIFSIERAGRMQYDLSYFLNYQRNNCSAKMGESTLKTHV